MHWKRKVQLRAQAIGRVAASWTTEQRPHGHRLVLHRTLAAEDFWRSFAVQQSAIFVLAVLGLGAFAPVWMTGLVCTLLVIQTIVAEWRVRYVRAMPVMWEDGSVDPVPPQERTKS